MAYTGHPGAGQPDTERPEEVPTTVEEKETETVRQKANKMFRRFFGTRREARPIQKVEDAPLEEEQYRELPDEPPPTPTFVLPKGPRKPGLPTVPKIQDTERPEEVPTTVEERPEKPSRAKEFTESVIKAIGPKKRVVTRVPRARIERDTEREFEETSVEKKPVPPDRSAEIWTESEKAFRGVTSKIRETGMGFREEGKRKEDLYSKTVYHTVGLTLRAGASAVEALTMPVRPILLAETAVLGLTAISKPVKSIGELGKAIMADPLGVTADIGGGYIGGAFLGKIITKAVSVHKARSLEKFLAETPAEDFFIKEELAMQYPETVIEYKPHLGGFRTPEKVRILDTTSSTKFGDISEGLPSDDIFQLKQYKTATTSALEQAKTAKEILDKARAERALLKGYKRVGDGLVPVLLPEGIGDIDTIYKASFIQIATEVHIPGIDIRLPSITPKVGDLSTIFGAIGAFSSLSLDLKTDTKPMSLVGGERSLHEVIEKPSTELERIIKMGERTIITPEPTPQQYRFPPFTRPTYDQPQKTIQEPELIQEPIPIPLTSLSLDPTLEIRKVKQVRKRVPIRRRQPLDMKVISISKIWGEERRYPIATRKQLEKALFGK